MKIPEEEIEFLFSRAGGPGGQHVNRRATRVEARWNVLESPSLTDEQRDILRERLAGRVSKEGILRVVADRERSQARNKQVAAARLRGLVDAALKRRKPRRRTRPPRSAEERRLREKKQRSEVKENRRPPTPEE